MINDESKIKLLSISDELHLNHYQLISEMYYKTIKCVRGGGQSSHFGNKYTMEFYNNEHRRCLKVQDNLLKNKKIHQIQKSESNNPECNNPECNNPECNNTEYNNLNIIQTNLTIIKKYLIIYSYFEHKNSMKNLTFFIKNGIINNNNVIYIFVINGNKCSINIPKYENIYIIRRDNKGHDFASWSHALKNHNYSEYDRFIFLNDTVIGPFIPLYVDNSNKWYEMFCKQLSNIYKLSGLSINYVPWNSRKFSAHVQSMMFCTDLIGLNILISNKILCDDLNNYINIIKDKRNFIKKYEIGMSEQIIKKGYKITCLNYTSLKNKEVGDIWYNNKYFNTTVNPLETMFIKSNRISNDLINFYINSLS